MAAVRRNELLKIVQPCRMRRKGLTLQVTRENVRKERYKIKKKQG